MSDTPANKETILGDVASSNVRPSLGHSKPSQKASLSEMSDTADRTTIPMKESAQSEGKAKATRTPKAPKPAKTPKAPKLASKASFIRLPDTKNKTASSSGLVTVVQEQAESYKALHIVPPPPVKPETEHASSELSEEQTQTAEEAGFKLSLTGQKAAGGEPSALVSGTASPSGQAAESGIAAVEMAESNSASVKGVLPETTHFSLKPPVAANPVPGNNAANNPDSFLQHLRNKKSSLDPGAQTKTTPNDAARHRHRQGSMAPTPSLLNMRSSIGQSASTTNNNNATTTTNNNNTISSTTTVQSKGSTRAEYFAAKLHDAIKDDLNNISDSEETFVYDTAPKQPIQAVAEEKTQTNCGDDPRDEVSPHRRSPRVRSHRPSYSSDLANASETHLAPRPSALLHHRPSGNPVLDSEADTMDVYSRSSTTTSRMHRDESMREASIATPANEDTHTQGQNQLREITSRIFDSKGVTPRKYSGMDVDNLSFDGDDEDEAEDLKEMYGDPNVGRNSTLAALTAYGQPHRSVVGGFPSSVDFESDVDDDYSITENAAANFHHNSATYGGPYDTYGSQGHTWNSMPTYRNAAAEMQPDDPLLEEGVTSYGTSSRPLRRKKKQLYFNPHDFTSARNRRLRQLKSFCYTLGLILLLLTVGFAGGFVLATSKELQKARVTSVHDILISDEEFVFTLDMEAFNPGVMPVAISDVQLDVFAKTKYIVDAYVRAEDDDENGSKPSYSTILLGSIDQLDIPLEFQPGCFTRQKDTSNTEIKIVNPCSFEDDHEKHHNKDGGDEDLVRIFSPEPQPDPKPQPPDTQPPDIHEPSMKWINISRNPFELIVRGVMSYQLPLSSSNRTVAVSYSHPVNPDKLH